VLSVRLRCTDTDYPFGIFCPSCCLFFFDVRIMITPLISFGHCAVCSSSMYGYWLPLWYLLAIVLSVLLRCTDTDYSFGIFWPLCCLFFFDIRILITPLVSFGHCVVCSSSIYGYWLPLWYLHTLLTSLSGFNLVSLVVITIDLYKVVVLMCYFCPVHFIYNCSEETVTLTSGICSYWYCHHVDPCGHVVFHYLLCATKSRMGASNRSGEMRSLTIIEMLFPV
jgi:hypothetical protein